jgi:hypothetical protein
MITEGEERIAKREKTSHRWGKMDEADFSISSRE